MKALCTAPSPRRGRAARADGERRPAPQLFDALAVAAIGRLDTFNEQNLANLAWAYATAGHPAPALLEAIAQAALAGASP